MGNGTQKYDPEGKGWFAIPGRQVGDRTLAEQMKGLDGLLPLVAGETVLDLGCAEGLISMEMLKAGATSVHGIESVESRVLTARKLFRGKPAEFFVADLDDFHTAPPAAVQRRYGVVLVLSIAQKMRRPGEFMAACATRCGGILAVRLPSPVIKDVRSGYVPCNVPRLLLELGFGAMYFAEGPRKEWVGVFSRQAVAE